MKVFFDTNIWIAAFVSPGACSELLDHCLLNHSLLTSQQILHEILDKLMNKLHFSKDNVGLFLEFIRENACLVDVKLPIPSICRDPDDNGILAAGRNGGSDCLISGDSDLLALKNFDGIPVIKPSDFWRFEQT